MRKVLTILLCVLFLTGAATSAQALLLEPGDTVDVTNAAAPGGTLLASQEVPFSNDYFSGMSYQSVYSNPDGILFIYSFDNSESSLNSITRMTAIDFTGFTTWGDASLVADPVYSMDRSITGDTIGFGFKSGSAQDSNFDPGVQPGSTSSVMWIQTNATDYTVGGLSLIDGRTSDILAYGPTNVIPEPMSLLLMGSGLFGLVGIGKKRIK